MLFVVACLLHRFFFSRLYFRGRHLVCPEVTVVTFSDTVRPLYLFCCTCAMLSVVSCSPGQIMTLRIIIIIILVITCMRGIYNCTPETNHVCTLYSVAAVLYVQSVLHVMLLRVLNMFCTFTTALPAVVCSAQCGCCLLYLNFVLSRYVA